MSVPDILWPGRSRLRHVKQLQTGSPTAATDCGPSSLLMAYQVVSGDDLRPPQSLHADWIKIERKAMTHFSFWPATSLQNHAESARSDHTEGAYLGMGRFTPSSAVQTLSHTDVIRELKDGCGVIVGIDYGRLNDLMPRLSGSTTFRGGHFIVLQGFENGFCRLGDPLHDGRQNYPRGWQTVRVLRYLRAAETFGAPKAGEGKAKVCVLQPAKQR